MRPGLEPGKTEINHVTVTAAMCPHFDGQLLHPVCATWTLVHQMEVVGRRLLAPHLEAHEEGIGAHIAIDHRAPAAIGAKVRFVAQVESVNAQRLTTKMSAFCGEQLLATGSFVQVILEKSRLAAILDQARRQSETQGESDQQFA